MKRAILFILCLTAIGTCFADNVLTGTKISSNGWTGLDLGKQHVITIVGWNPPNAIDVLLGVFEGANSPDFIDAIPLMIISGNSFAGQMNYANVNCSRGFRYVRYVAPEGKQNIIPTLEFWGEEGVGNNSQLAQLTNIPTVTIHTKNEERPYDKEHEIVCLISIISNNGKTLLTDSATIRLRGNASTEFPKKPYRIKFAKKHQVLGAPANAKKWTLINNYGDKTLMRNQLAFELSRRFQMPYTPFCAYVDVLLNGNYQGCYQLCDQIEVRSKRVDVKEMTDKDNSGEALTGGYLIEADAYAGNEPSMFWSAKGTPVTIKSPDDDIITPQQAAYIKGQYDQMESNWKSNLDLNTFLRHFLVGELSGNTDTYWSLYLYKQRANDTLFVGPVWDFDIAFDNDYRTYHVNDKSDYIYRSGGSTTGYLRTLVDKIVINDNDAKQQLATIWANTRRAGLTEDFVSQYIDEQAAILDQSQRLNFLRWPIMNEYVHMNPRVRGSYQAEVENVRSFLTKRIQWMDKKLGFDATSMENNDVVCPSDPEEKQGKLILRDGQLLIIRGDKVYTITGQRL